MHWSRRDDFASLRLRGADEVRRYDDRVPGYHRDVGIGAGDQLHPAAPAMAPTRDPALRAQHLLSVSASMEGMGVRVIASVDPVHRAHVSQAVDIVEQPVIWIAPRVWSGLVSGGSLQHSVLAASQGEIDGFRATLPMFFPQFLPIQFRQALEGMRSGARRAPGDGCDSGLVNPVPGWGGAEVCAGTESKPRPRAATLTSAKGHADHR